MTESAKVDTSRPNGARVYDYLLGGRDNFAADRVQGDRMIASMPTARTRSEERRVGKECSS